MKTWAKVGIGCLVVLVLACIISAAVFFFAGGWVKNKIKSATGDLAEMGKSAAVMNKLNADYPFTPPADGEVNESRLQAYISVCNEAKPAVDAYGAWIKSHEGQEHGKLSDVKEAVTHMGAAAKAIGDALKSHRMSPKEFSWIGRTMDEASREQPADTMTEGQRQLIKVLEAQINDPSTSEAARNNLKQQIAQLKAGAGESAPPSHNAELYKRYEDQLKACRLGPYGEILMGSMAAQGTAH
jgi:hypothetical protein